MKLLAGKVRNSYALGIEWLPPVFESHRDAKNEASSKEYGVFDPSLPSRGAQPLFHLHNKGRNEVADDSRNLFA